MLVKIDNEYYYIYTDKFHDALLKEKYFQYLLNTFYNLK